LPLRLYEGPFDQPIGRRWDRCLGIPILVRGSCGIGRRGNNDPIPISSDTEARSDYAATSTKNQPFRPEKERAHCTIAKLQLKGLLPGMLVFIFHREGNERGGAALIICVHCKYP
jgi:hypothetical protein